MMARMPATASSMQYQLLMVISSGEILALSLTDGAWAHPTQDLPGSHTFVLGACAGENSLIALDGTSILRLIRNP